MPSVRRSFILDEKRTALERKRTKTVTDEVDRRSTVALLDGFIAKHLPPDTGASREK
jgi:hypothetical protein